MTQFTKEDMQKHSAIFDEFVNTAISELDTSEINIVEVMTAYNYIKNALASINTDED